MRKELGHIHIMITAQLLPARAPALSLLAPPPAGRGQGRGVEQCCSWVIPSSSHSSAGARTWRNDGQSRRGRARSIVSCCSAGCMPSRLYGTVTKAVVTNTEFSLSLVLSTPRLG